MACEWAPYILATDQLRNTEFRKRAHSESTACYELLFGRYSNNNI